MFSSEGNDLYNHIVARAMIQRAIMDTINPEQEAEEKRPPLSELWTCSLDELLDIYNDYNALYETFTDVEYKEYAGKVMALIKGKFCNDVA